MFKLSELCIHIIFILQLCVRCESFKISNFHDFCDTTISDDAGELRLDARELPSYLPGNKCRVTVKPLSDVLKENTQVLFYFTQFYFIESCERMNVTVEDGPIFHRTVESLPGYLCGHNKSLEEKDHFFTTRTDQFTITLSRKDASYSQGNFSVKFIAFHTGKCKGNDVFNCSNGRCVDYKYACSDEIEACGEKQLQCDYLKAVIEIVETILDVIKKYSWILPVLIYIGLCILKCIYKRNRKCICDLKSSVCSRLRKLVRSCCRESDCHRDSSRQSSDSDNFVPLQQVPVRRHLNLPQARENAREIAREIADENDRGTDYISNIRQSSVQPRVTSFNEVHPSAPSFGDSMTSSDVPQRIDLPSAPPPSYEEVVAPSYQDVIANRHKYNYKTTVV